MVERIGKHETLRDYLPLMSVDHDGVMADTGENSVRHFNRILKTNYSVRDINGWNSIIDWGLKEGLSEKAAKELNDTIWFDSEMLLTAKPVKGAVEFMYKAYSQGCEIPIISSRLPSLRESTLLWYKKYMQWIPEDNIFVCLPEIPDGSLSKKTLIKALGRKLHIDDWPGHMDMILGSSDCMGILISDDLSLDGKYDGRLIRFPKDENGNPSFREISKLFF